MPKVVCRCKTATPPSSPFLQGTAPPWFNLPAIPPGLVSLRLRKCRVAFEQHGCSAPSTLACLQLTKPSGQAGHSRPHPLPAVGAEDAVQPPHPVSGNHSGLPPDTYQRAYARRCRTRLQASIIACHHPTLLVIHCAGQRSASASVRRTLIPATVPVREDRCTPHHPLPALTPLGRSGPGGVGSLPTHSAGLCRGLGA